MKLYGSSQSIGKGLCELTYAICKLKIDSSILSSDSKTRVLNILKFSAINFSGTFPAALNFVYRFCQENELPEITNFISQFPGFNPDKPVVDVLYTFT